MILVTNDDGVDSPGIHALAAALLADGHDLIVVAPTDAQAEALARSNYAVWYANLTKLWRDFGAIPFRFARDFDEARQRGLAVAGTASRVREELERQIAVSTCTYLVIRPIFGDVSEAQAAASTDRFASEVLPHLSALKPTS